VVKKNQEQWKKSTVSFWLQAGRRELPAYTSALARERKKMCRLVSFSGTDFLGNCMVLDFTTLISSFFVRLFGSVFFESLLSVVCDFLGSV